MKKEFSPSLVPHRSGVYVYRNRFGEVIYVGKAADLRRRMSSYFQPSRREKADPKLRSLINAIYDWSFEVVRTPEEALILESRLIKEYAPYYNILMRDDKRYLMLKLDMSEKFPTLRTTRVKKDDNCRYFGPFPHGGALKSTLEYLLCRFKLRACRSDSPGEEERKRCMKRFVKDCCAPCTGKVSEAEYRANLDAALAVLEGDISGLREELKAKMAAESAAQRFEKAAAWRDVLSNLETVFGRVNRSFERPELPGGNPPGMSGVKSLQEALALAHPPRRIICFDISNIGGKLAVASMVAMRDGKPDRDEYRRFRIRTVEGSNDFAMMKEVIKRRFLRLMEEKRPFPDLLMVDGGKGQLSSAIDALVEINAPPLPVIGLAKKNEEIFTPGDSEPLVLSRHDGALKMLQLLRDESHRFAISYHRELRNKRLTESLLDEIPGVGEARKKALLKHFGSVRGLRKATPEEVAEAVPGIGITLAESILRKIGKKEWQKEQKGAIFPENGSAVVK